ncbi:hypothetical protein CXG46_00680 [Nocardioides alpinus]|nr:hypothetical protein CXG46_00680 [Nocardioides alpinus]
MVPVALLLCSIAVHGFQIVAHEDDPQRSGAFAMFSTIDIGATRKIVVTAQDGAVLLELPESMGQQGLSLLDRPSEKAATSFVSELTELTWTVADGVATEGGSETFDGLRLQVVGLGNEGRTLHRTVLVDVVVGPSS